MTYSAWRESEPAESKPDPVSDPDSYNDASGTTQYCYDRFGQLTRKVQTTNGTVLSLRYAYTTAGQLSSITYPDGTLVDYQLDALGRTTSVGVTASGGVRQVLLHEATYYPFGPAAEWVFGNGRLFQRTLNQNYQPGVVQDGFPGGLSLGYEFDAVGNLSTLRNGDQTDPPQRLFGYDALNRLIEAKDGATGSLLEGYSYDATGNRQSATVGAVTTAYTTEAGSHRLSAVGTVTRNYDAAGSTIAIGGTERQFVYDATGRMSQVLRSNAIAMNYRYNGKGEQVHRYLGTGNIYTMYDEAGHWLGDYDSTGTPIQQAIWLDDLPVGVIAGGNLHYIEADHLGTPRVVIDPQRDVPVWRWDLTGEAFGDSAPNQDPDGDASEFVLNMRFPGQRYDAASGLNYNYFRDYDSAAGRYVESDPVGLEGGASTYSYVEGSPLLYVDPNGLAKCTYTITAKRLVCEPESRSNPHVDIPVASGNNGNGQQCKDNPDCIKLRNRGPLPTGQWRWNIGGPGSANSKSNGRRLVPGPGTKTYDRSAFLTHSCLNAFGPSLGPKFCSEGCITGAAADIKLLNQLLDAEPDSTLTVQP